MYGENMVSKMNKVQRIINKLERSILYYIDAPKANEEYLKLVWDRNKCSEQGKLNLDKPRRFNEKIQWLKLNYHNPILTVLVDKIEVKKYVKEIIGEEHVIKTLCVWESADEIDISELPEQFVIKCNHDTGSAIVCRDKSAFELEAAKAKFRKSMKQNLFYAGREWAYKEVRPKVFAEEYIGNKKQESLTDYKFMCFDGKVKCAFTVTNRFDSTDEIHVTFFDREWKRMPFERHYKAEQRDIPKPHKYNEMIEIAERLSKGFPFVRIDLYEDEDKILFGEYTFYPGGGFEEFSSVEWDEKLGEWINLEGIAH